MHAAQLEYVPASDAAGMPLAVSVFADRTHVRGQIAEDVAGAGFRVLREAALAEVLDGAPGALGEIVLLDCPRIDGATLAALARLDMRIARSGARLVVSTTIEALEDVFACLDQSAPRILVAPTRGERVVAIGEELTKIARVRVREHSDRDQVSLLRLAEQVSEIARKLDALTPSNDDGRGSAFRFESPAPGFSGPDGGDASDRLTRAARPPLPDPRLVRQIIRQRQVRSRFFDGDLFADPAWDILLDLARAKLEGQQVSVSSVCIAASVPMSTALRWVRQMTDAGLLRRWTDPKDRRRDLIALTDATALHMRDYLAAVYAQIRKI